MRTTDALLFHCTKTERRPSDGFAIRNPTPLMKIARSPHRAILGMALSALGVLSVSFPVAHAAPPAGYTLVWADQFDGTTLDSSHWNHTYPGTYRDAFNTPEGSTVAGGNLTIATYTDNGIHYTDHLDTKN